MPAHDATLRTAPRSRLRRTLSHGLAGLALMPALARAAFPERPVRLVVSRPPGGVSDVIGRALARGLTDQVRQFVIVENVAGERGRTALRAVASAPADGYLLLLADPGHLRIAAPSDEPPRLLHEFAPLALAAVSALVLVVNPERVAAASLPALLRAAAGRDVPLRFTSPGPGSFSRLVGDEFVSVTGLRAVHEPGSRLADAIHRLLDGRADAAFLPAGAALPLIQAGRLRPLGVTTRRTIDALPDVPPLPDHDSRLLAPIWHAVMAPAGLPRDLHERLQRAVVAARAEPSCAATIASVGAVPATLPAGETGAFLEAQRQRWSQIASRIPARS